jgi:hypothetical protein
VIVPAGAMTASFSVSTNPVSAYTLVNISASYSGKDQFAEFSVRVS